MPFSYSYKQPDEYHFCLDSIEFAAFVAKEIESNPNINQLNVLDLCAGCGVIGIELSWHIKAIRFIDFIEIQSGYTDFFWQNIELVNRDELSVNWHNINYDALHEKHFANKYDLIVSNPPYFVPKHGMLSPSPFKNRCRFYLDSTFENYIKAIANSLTMNGRAFVMMRPLAHHGIDLLKDIREIVQDTFIAVKTIGKVRQSCVILLKKNSRQCETTCSNHIDVNTNKATKRIIFNINQV